MVQTEALEGRSRDIEADVNRLVRGGKGAARGNVLVMYAWACIGTCLSIRFGRSFVQWGTAQETDRVEVVTNWTLSPWVTSLTTSPMLVAHTLQRVRKVSRSCQI